MFRRETILENLNKLDKNIFKIKGIPPDQCDIFYKLDQMWLISYNKTVLTLYYPLNDISISYREYVKLLSSLGIKATRKKNILYLDGIAIGDHSSWSFKSLQRQPKSGEQPYYTLDIKRFAKIAKESKVPLIPASYIEANSPFVFGHQLGCNQSFEETFGKSFLLVKDRKSQDIFLYSNKQLVITYLKTGEIKFDDSVFKKAKLKFIPQVIKGGSNGTTN